MAPSVPVDQFEQSMRATAQRQTSKCPAGYPGLEAELIVAEDPFRGQMLGLVGQRCAHHATRSVVIVPRE